MGRPESERASFSCKKTNQQSTRQAREYLGQELGTELRVGQAATPEARPEGFLHIGTRR